MLVNTEMVNCRVFWILIRIKSSRHVSIKCDTLAPGMFKIHKILIEGNPSFCYRIKRFHWLKPELILLVHWSISLCFNSNCFEINGVQLHEI